MPIHSNLQVLFVSLAAFFTLSSCATSPTGQMQLKLYPDDKMAKMGVAAFSEMKQKTPVTKDAEKIRYVNCVAKAITDALPKKSHWEVNVFEDNQVNAFALPGGKIGVYTGLLNVAANQDQLATVIGHEVAHVLADHGNARVSASTAAHAGVTVASILGAVATNDPMKRQMLGLLGVGVQVGVLLPYGRSQESEADSLGLDLMAKAGFNPRESVPLWENMGKAGGGGSPEFLSTHPSNATRINDLNKRMSKALSLQNKAHSAGLKPACG